MTISTFPSPKKLTSVPLLFMGIIVDLYLFVNGKALFGSQWDAYQTILLYYLVLLGATLFFAQNSPQLKISIMTAFIYFIPTFLIVVVFLSTFHQYPNPPTLSFIVLTLINEIFVVSLSEEVMFRGVIINYIGVIPQGILFGLFHTMAYYTVYGLDVYSMIIAMALGILLGFIVQMKPKYGVAITWGIHAGWNVALLIPIFSLHYLL